MHSCALSALFGEAPSPSVLSARCLHCTLELWPSFWAPSEPDVLSSRLGLPTQPSLVMKSVWDSHSVPNRSNLPYSSCLQLTLPQHSNISVKVPGIYHCFFILGCPRVCLGSYHATWEPRGPESTNLNSLLPLCFIRGPLTPRWKHGQCPPDSELSPNPVQEEGRDVYIAPCFPITTSSNNSLGAFVSISCQSEYPYITASFPPPFHWITFAKWLLCNIQGIDPGQCGSIGCPSSHAPKGCCMNPSQDTFPVVYMQEVAN